MYGPIEGSQWGEQSDSYESDRFYDDTQKVLDAAELENWCEDWDQNSEFRTDFEQFLSDVTSARQRFREELWPDQEIRELIQKYLKTPLWHLPQITNFL